MYRLYKLEFHRHDQFQSPDIRERAVVAMIIPLPANGQLGVQLIGQAHQDWQFSGHADWLRRSLDRVTL